MWQSTADSHFHFVLKRCMYKHTISALPLHNTASNFNLLPRFLTATLCDHFLYKNLFTALELSFLHDGLTERISVPSVAVPPRTASDLSASTDVDLAPTWESLGFLDVCFIAVLSWNGNCVVECYSVAVLKTISINRVSILTFWSFRCVRLNAY